MSLANLFYDNILKFPSGTIVGNARCRSGAEDYIQISVHYTGCGTSHTRNGGSGGEAPGTPIPARGTRAIKGKGKNDV